MPLYSRLVNTQSISGYTLLDSGCNIVLRRFSTCPFALENYPTLCMDRRKG